MSNDIQYWVAFSQISKIGPIRFNRLLNYFPDMAAAWQAPIRELIESKIEENVAEEFVIKRQEINPEAKVIFGAVQDEKLKNGEIKVTVIATGF